MYMDWVNITIAYSYIGASRAPTSGTPWRACSRRSTGPRKQKHINTTHKLN